MAKPDLQPVYVNIDVKNGQLSRLRSNLSLAQVFGSSEMTRTAAEPVDLEVGGIWIDTANEVLRYKIS